MFSIGRHESENGLVIGLCDASILGKTISCSETSLFVDPRFYGGSLINEDQLEDAFRSAYVINILGNDAVKACEAKNLIKKDSARSICGILHVQLLIAQP
ncbi:MAG TPA: DUF424 family protein [Thermoprotei archaeon]|nr:DUF424 family protein [Thermoprotei archaeon]